MADLLVLELNCEVGEEEQDAPANTDNHEEDHRDIEVVGNSLTVHLQGSDLVVLLLLEYERYCDAEHQVKVDEYQEQDVEELRELGLEVEERIIVVQGDNEEQLEDRHPCEDAQA